MLPWERSRTEEIIRKVTQPFKQFYEWAVKVCQYAVLLWSDREYDYCYAMYLLEFKLERIAKHIQKHQIIERADEVAGQIRVVTDLIRQFQASDFLPELMTAHEEKWGVMEHYFEPCKDPGHEDMFEWKHHFPGKSYTQEELDQESSERSEVYHRQEEAKQQCWKKIWELISEQGQGWWD